MVKRCGTDRRSRVIRVVCFCCFFLILIRPEWSGLAQQAGPEAVVVGGYRVTAREINPPEEFVGHVEAVQWVDLYARVEGFIEKVNFKEGSMVKAGELLYVIEQAPYQAKVDAALADVREAEAELDKARRRLNRLRSARPESVSRTDMDEAITAEMAARARLEKARAQLKLAQIDLGYTEIRAPIDGRIGKTRYTVGNLVNTSSGPLARIVQINPIRVVYSISENDVALVKAAMADTEALAPSIRLPDGSVYEKKGRVEFVNNEVDPATGTIAVRALFENPEGILIPGQYVTVLLRKSKPQVLPVVPQSAVLMSAEGNFVFVVDDKGIVRKRSILLGPTVDTYWAVRSGVKEGEVIIVEGIHKIREGQQVIVKGTETPGAR